MNNLLSKRSLLLFSSLFLHFVFSSNTNGCADGYDPSDDFFGSLFAPEIIREPEHTPMFLSGHEFYSSPGFNGENIIVEENLEKNMNTGEWVAYFDKKIKPEDILPVIYVFRKGMIDTLQLLVDGSGIAVADSLIQQNALLQIKNKKKVTEALTYLKFAKQCEEATFETGYYWYDDEARKESNEKKLNQNRCYRTAETILETKLPDFIKQRYLYHAIRLKYFLKDYDGGIILFNKYQKLAEQNKSSVYYKTIGYLAGCYYKTKNFSQANYLYAFVFNSYKPGKATAYQSFHPQEQADWNESLKLAKTKEEQESLWLLFGLYADPTEAMQRIYDLNPGSSKLNLLLVRSVNIAEAHTLSYRNPDYNFGYWDNEEELYFLPEGLDSFDLKLFQFVKQCSQKGNTQKPEIWTMSYAHLLYLKKDFNEAAKQLEKVHDKNNPLLTEQKKLSGILIKEGQHKTIDTAFEADIINDLQWLEEHRGDELRSKNAFYELMHRLANKYDKQHDEVKAALCRNNAALKNDMVQPLLDFMNRKDHSVFEAFLVSNYRYKKEDFYEYQGTQLLYEYRFKEAIARFKLSGFKEELPGDPFIIHIQDCHDCDHGGPPKVKYTKITFAQKMIQLMDAAQKDKSKASSYYFLIANGFYNMTYYGNSRALTLLPNVYNYYSEDQEHQKDISADHENYFNCDKAEAFYMKAMSMSQSREFAAKCYFMASKCEQNKDYYSSNEESNDYGFTEPGYNNRKYFTILKTSYANTEYYKEIINECGYFRTFIAKK